MKDTDLTKASPTISGAVISCGMVDLAEIIVGIKDRFGLPIDL